MIIGLTGYKGSGKSEAAKYLEENYKFKRVNFKDELVDTMKRGMSGTIAEICKMLDKTDYDGRVWTEERLFKEKPPVFRALMQDVGTGLFRNEVDSDHWAHQWVAKVNELRGNIVTDDVRFFNELSALTEKNGILIRIVREDITEGGEHQSEKEQEKFIEDFTVVAVKGDIEGMHRQIDKIIAHIKAD
jgi:hypothetical protein